MVSIVGKNGAGKSTLSKLLLRLRKEDRGRISLRGRYQGQSIKERAEIIAW
jgi:ABC-type bacteriocin/lantibiotic exporter with double-glycine peptidase domain